MTFDLTRGVANTRAWRYHIPEIWKRPLNSTPTSFPAGLAGVTQHRATPEPNFTKERATRRRKSKRNIFVWGGSINLDLDLG